MVRVSQTKGWSMVEAVANVIIGYAINIVVQAVVFPLFGMHISWQDNLVVGLIFTIVSITRSYGMRRAFNHLHAVRT